MINIYIFIIIILALPRVSTLPFGVPRRFMIAFGLPLAMASGLTLPTVGISLVAIIALSTVASSRRDIATRYLILLAGAVFLGAAASVNVLTLMVWAAVVHSLAHLAQNLTGRLSWIDPMAAGVGGLAGNSAHLGTYLVPHVFIAVHTGQFWAVLIVVAAMVTSRCRGALVGLAAGMVAIEPLLILPILLGGYVWCRQDGRGTSSMVSRVMALRHANEHLSPRILAVGAGGDVGRCLFMRETKFTRLHNDLVQAVFDGGVVAAALYLAAGLSTVWCAASSGSPWLAAAMVSLMAAGLFLHTQHIALSLIVFWVIVGQAGPVVEVGPGWAAQLPVAVPVFAIGFAVFGCWVTWGRELMSDILLRRWQATDDWRPLVEAHRLTPRSGPINVILSVLAFNAGRFRESIQHGSMVINNYDGDGYLATAHYAAGMSYIKLGMIPQAERHLSMACKLDPKDESFRDALEKAHAPTNS